LQTIVSVTSNVRQAFRSVRTPEILLTPTNSLPFSRVLTVS
jgi:hypothetical protein